MALNSKLCMRLLRRLRHRSPTLGVWWCTGLDLSPSYPTPAPTPRARPPPGGFPGVQEPRARALRLERSALVEQLCEMRAQARAPQTGPAAALLQAAAAAAPESPADSGGLSGLNLGQHETQQLINVLTSDPCLSADLIKVGWRVGGWLVGGCKGWAGPVTGLERGGRCVCNGKGSATRGGGERT